MKTLWRDLFYLFAVNAHLSSQHSRAFLIYIPMLIGWNITFKLFDCLNHDVNAVVRTC